MAKRDHITKVRLTADELARLDELRAATGLSRAEQFRRDTLSQSASRALAFGAELAALKSELGKIGSNMNQIAYVANSTGQVGQIGELDELRRLVTETRQAIRR